MVFSLFTRAVLCLYDFWEQWCAQEHNFLSFCTQAKRVISLVHVLKNVLQWYREMKNGSCL